MLARLRTSIQGFGRPARRGGLLFVFGGASHNWRGPGWDLYRSEAVFREAVDAADAQVRQSLGFSASAMFRDEWHPERDEDRRRADIVSMGLLHLGLTDLWTAAGIRPDGVIGISLGEIGSAYAAGALDRNGATAVICTIARSLGIQSDDHVLLVAKAPRDRLLRLCDTAPVPLFVAGEPVPGTSALLTRSPHIEAVRAHLRGRARIVAEHDTKWPYHVPGIAFDANQAATDLSGLAWGKPRIPLFLAHLGGRAPDGQRFDSAYWTAMAISPYWLAGASRAAFAEGYDVLVNIGAASIGQWVADASPRAREVELIDATPVGGGSATWREALARVSEVRGPGPCSPALPADLAAPETLADPYAEYERLRRGGSVHYLPKQDAWIVLAHRDVKAALADSGNLSNAPYRSVGPVLMASDPPEHLPIRRLVSPLFSPAAIAALAEAAAKQSRLVRPELDLVAGFARPIALLVGADLLSFPPESRAGLSAAGDRYRAGGRVVSEYLALLDPLADESGAAADLEARGAGLLTRAEARQLVTFLWLAATETTERLIVHCALSLLRDPGLLEAVREDEARLAPFVEEVLRLYPPELMVPRLTMAPVTLGGVTIPAGQRVMLCLAAANRDPARFEAPDRLRIDRGPNDHLSFGSGIHRCSGTALARSVVPAALKLLLDPSRRLRPAEPLDSLRTFASPTVHTPERLLVSC
ncbi:MAG TPA: cytochrome P450 [Allosphingosinicella sp.]